MKVLLVRPLLLNMLAVTGAIDCEPLELEYLYTACREIGADACIYDGIVESRRFRDVLRAYRPDVVAVTGYITQETRIRRYAAAAKAICPGCCVVLGGTHAQLNYRRLYFPEVDFITRSESMQDFQAFLSAVEKDTGYETVNGLCWRQTGIFRENAYRPGDIAGLPIPDRTFRNRHAEAFRYLDYERVSTLKTAVSCPFSCLFCYGTHLHGGRYQARPVEMVVEEIASLEAETIFIVDSDFPADIRRTQEFIRLLKERNIRKHYIAYARADFIVQHPDVVAGLCKVGFAMFLVGLEGIQDDRLEAYHKGTSLAVNEACVRILQNNHATCVALMMADPSFTKDDFRRLYEWVKSQPLRYVTVQIYTPIPSTPLFEAEKEQIFEKHPEKWDLAHLVVKPDHMPVWLFHWRHRLLVARLYWLGYRRGAYHFVTPAFISRQIIKCWKRLRTL